MAQAGKVDRCEKARAGRAGLITFLLVYFIEDIRAKFLHF
ncbi:Uncharacterised protein [Leminorella grimontii]|nr:hypothetical protein GLGR_1910 [Leminorella grimontii ATCC 33999 = DSM 5078]VFS60152.1 Uncharacterised protein [Leminorella grimontii]